MKPIHGAASDTAVDSHVKYVTTTQMPSSTPH
jgi:hypothetical protein